MKDNLAVIMVLKADAAMQRYKYGISVWSNEKNAGVS
jgi:hypothetical protein